MLKGFLLVGIMVLNSACGSLSHQARKPGSKFNADQALLAKYQKQTLELLRND